MLISATTRGHSLASASLIAFLLAVPPSVGTAGEELEVSAIKHQDLSATVQREALEMLRSLSSGPAPYLPRANAQTASSDDHSPPFLFRSDSLNSIAGEWSLMADSSATVDPGDVASRSSIQSARRGRELLVDTTLSGLLAPTVSPEESQQISGQSRERADTIDGGAELVNLFRIGIWTVVVLSLALVLMIGVKVSLKGREIFRQDGSALCHVTTIPIGSDFRAHLLEAGGGHYLITTDRTGVKTVTPIVDWIGQREALLADSENSDEWSRSARSAPGALKNRKAKREAEELHTLSSPR